MKERESKVMKAKLKKDNSYFIVPAKNYNVRTDNRLLIPFVQNQKIGFVDKRSNIIVEPKYDIIYGNFIEDSDFVSVGVRYSYGFPKLNGRVQTYNRNKWGLLYSNGNEVFKCDYASIAVSDDKKLFTLKSYDYGYCVVDLNGKVVVPYGDYSIIEGYINGKAKVKKNGKWGIIDTKGNVILPLDYGEIWLFHNKNYDSTNDIKRENEGLHFNHTSGKHINPSHKDSCQNRDDRHYGDYAGSYGQDVMGFSDDVINDAFEGDPDACWNID